MITLAKDTCCSYCGWYFPLSITGYPKKCTSCGNETYSNPLPVTASMVTCKLKDGSQGILLVKRGKEPELGGWCFPGGYIETGETWQQAAVREIKEEIGLELNPEQTSLWTVLSGTKNLIIFTLNQTNLKYNDIKFVPNKEVLDISLSIFEEELCFPTHTLVLKSYFNNTLKQASAYNW